MRVIINVPGLWEHWDPNQRDHNIYRPAVERYIQIMRTMTYARSPAVRLMMQNQVEPIIFAMPNEEMKIRTSDGRHRITAAHELGLATITALDTPMAQMIKDIYGI